MIHRKLLAKFIVFNRSPMLKYDLSDLSVNVGGNIIKPSEKVRDLGHCCVKTIIPLYICITFTVYR